MAHVFSPHQEEALGLFLQLAHKESFALPQFFNWKAADAAILQVFESLAEEHRLHLEGKSPPPNAFTDEDYMNDYFSDVLHIAAGFKHYEYEDIAVPRKDAFDVLREGFKATTQILFGTPDDQDEGLKQLKIQLDKPTPYDRYWEAFTKRWHRI